VSRRPADRAATASRVIDTRSAAETAEVGAAVGRALLAAGRPPAAAPLLLHGPLGAGKTCFVQGLARGLGIRGTPRSPSFALHLTHEGERTLHHLDLYRIRSAGALDELGLEEVFSGEGVVAVEWAERLGLLEPRPAVHVTLEPTGGDRRRITFSGDAAWISWFAAFLPSAAGG
jgi:tRNA threonylcarbamoyladenosine biosynthesis protein TsaE